VFCLRNKGIRLQLAVGEKRKERVSSLSIVLKGILALPLQRTCNLGCEEHLRLFHSLRAVEPFNDLRLLSGVNDLWRTQ
jgi:hypothetical protein